VLSIIFYRNDLINGSRGQGDHRRTCCTLFDKLDFVYFLCFGGIVISESGDIFIIFLITKLCESLFKSWSLANFTGNGGQWFILLYKVAEVMGIYISIEMLLLQLRLKSITLWAFEDFE